MLRDQDWSPIGPNWNTPSDRRVNLDEDLGTPDVNVHTDHTPDNLSRTDT